MERDRLISQFLFRLMLIAEKAIALIEGFTTQYLPRSISEADDDSVLTYSEGYASEFSPEVCAKALAMINKFLPRFKKHRAYYASVGICYRHYEDRLLLQGALMERSEERL